MALFDNKPKDRMQQKIQLSSQAKWYLQGHWPISFNDTVGNKPPDRSAIQELVDNKLAFWSETGTYAQLTVDGDIKRQALRNAYEPVICKKHFQVEPCTRCMIEEQYAE